MRFEETELPGAFAVRLETRSDDRGFFARSFCRSEFIAHGLNPLVEQANVGFSRSAGTVRGMHFQFPPAAEAKFVRCTRGAVRDVIVDLRPESPTFLRHLAMELSEENGTALYVPERFAHGYQTLRDNSEVSYNTSAAYSPENESGLRHDDPRLGITWPLPVAAISAKDAGWPDFETRDSEIRARMSAASALPHR